MNRITSYNVCYTKLLRPLLQSYLSSDQADINLGPQFMTNFFGSPLGYVFEDYNYMYEFEEYGYGDEDDFGTMASYNFV